MTEGKATPELTPDQIKQADEAAAALRDQLANQNDDALLGAKEEPEVPADVTHETGIATEARHEELAPVLEQKVEQARAEAEKAGEPFDEQKAASEAVVSLGARGANVQKDFVPADVAALKEKAAHEAAKSTQDDSKDSFGNPKGEFEVTKLGEDKHGAKIADQVDYEKPVESVGAPVGPRGATHFPDTHSN